MPIFFEKSEILHKNHKKNQISCHDTKTLYLKTIQIFTLPYLLYSVPQYNRKLGAESFWKLPSET